MNRENYKFVKVKKGEDCCVKCVFRSFYNNDDCKVYANSEFDCISEEGYFIEVNNDD